MLIAGVNQGVVPLEKSDMQSEDPLVSSDRENQERALLYVAAPAPEKKFSSPVMAAPARSWKQGRGES